MYAKLFASLYQGTLRGCSDEILVFTNLLAHADASGVVDKHWRAIAQETGLARERVEAAIATLEAPDPESRSPEEEGRRLIRTDEHRNWGWRIVNHAKYRAIRNEDDRREQNRKAQERWRNKQSKPRKPESAQAETEANTDTEARNTKPPAKRGKPAFTISVQDLVSEGVEEQHAQDWFRARKKTPLTPTAWAKVKSEAEKARMTPAEAVKTCAERQWRGFDSSWLHGASTSHPASKQEALEKRNAATVERLKERMKNGEL